MGEVQSGETPPRKGLKARVGAWLKERLAQPKPDEENKQPTLQPELDLSDTRFDAFSMAKPAPLPPDVFSGGLAELIKVRQERAARIEWETTVARVEEEACSRNKVAESKKPAFDPEKPFAVTHRPFKPLDAAAYREHLAIKGVEPQKPPRGPRKKRLRPAAAACVRHGRTSARFSWMAVCMVSRALHKASLWLWKAAQAWRNRPRKTESNTVTFWEKAQSVVIRLSIMTKARIAGWRQRRRGAEPGIMPAALSFQPDLDEIIEAAPPHAMRSVHYFIVSLFAALVLIASLVKVEIVVSGAGHLTTEVPPVVLQPMERAIIRDIKVKVGDAVKKGQVLADLDPTFSNADMETLTVQARSLSAQLRRIEAEMNGEPFIVQNPNDADEALQSDIYHQRESQYAARLRAFDEDINRLKANIQASTEDRAYLAQQLGIANEVEAMRTKLWEGRLTSKLQYLDSQNTRLRFQRDHQSVLDRLTDLQHNLQGKEAERQAFVDDWRGQLLEELLTKRTELAKVNEARAKVARLHDLVRLTAPSDGVVLEVARRSVGSVLREAEPLVTMVPSEATLIAEVMIGSSDVGYARPGDKVVLKVDAFPYQRHGMMEGRLISISEESFNPGSKGIETNMPSGPGAQHRARIALTKTQLDDMADDARLIPGMTLTAEIKVGKRSVISYFINPITRGFGESIREP